MKRARTRARRQAVLTMLVTMVAWRGASGHHAVLRFNLEEMVVTADRVFVGRCVGIQPGQEEIGQGRLPVTYYTFDVEQVLKGGLAPRFTFTQLGHPPRPARKGEPSSHGQAVRPGITLHGAADFAVGDRLLVLLTPNYNNGRLTYPVGLDQGAFVIEDDGTGQLLARNNLNNLGLFSAPYNNTRIAAGQGMVVHPGASEPLANNAALSSAARGLSVRRGSVPLTPLLELIERIHAAHGGVKGRVVPSGGQR